MSSLLFRMLPYRWMKFFEQEDVPPSKMIDLYNKRKASDMRRYVQFVKKKEEEILRYRLDIHCPKQYELWLYNCLI